MTSTAPALRVGVPGRPSGAHETHPADLCRVPTKTGRACRRSVRSCDAPGAPQHQRELEGERLAGVGGRQPGERRRPGAAGSARCWGARRGRGRSPRATGRAGSTPSASRSAVAALACAQRHEDLLDQVPAGVAVAGEHPLGQQVVAGHRAGRVGPADGGPRPDSAARAETWAAARSSATRADHDRAVAEVARPPRGRPCRGRRPPPRITTSRSPWTAHRASMPAARAARRTSSKRSLACAAPARSPRTTVTPPRCGPAQRAGPRGARPRRPRRAARSRRPAPRAGRPRRRAPRRPGRRPRRWRRRPRGRSAATAACTAGASAGSTTSSTCASTTSMPSRTRSTVWPRRDHAGQGPRGGAEDRGGGVAGRGVVVAEPEPVDEALDAGLQDLARPRTGSRRVSSREPRHVGEPSATWRRCSARPSRGAARRPARSRDASCGAAPHAGGGLRHGVRRSRLDPSRRTRRSRPEMPV